MTTKNGNPQTLLALSLVGCTILPFMLMAVCYEFSQKNLVGILFSLFIMLLVGHATVSNFIEAFRIIAKNV